MLRLMFQAIFLAFALIANLYMTGDASAELVCGALLAICCASVGGVCALIGMERCPIAGVGLRRLHHAFMVRDGADRRIQCSHVACSLT